MPVTLGSHPRHLEELRLGGGFDYSPGGGADFDAAGNIQSNGDLEMDGTGTFGGNVSVGGDLEVAGLDTNWRVYLPATLGLPDPSLPCGAPTVINWRNYQVVTAGMEFDPDTSQAAFFQFRLPPGYDDRPLKVTIEWATTDGTGGDVRWGINPISFSNGSTLFDSGPLYYGMTTFDAIEKFQEVTIEVSDFESDGGRFTTLRVIRVAPNELDTFDGTARLVGVEIGI